MSLLSVEGHAQQLEARGDEGPRANLVAIRCMGTGKKLLDEVPPSFACPC